MNNEDAYLFFTVRNGRHPRLCTSCQYSDEDIMIWSVFSSQSTSVLSTSTT